MSLGDAMQMASALWVKEAIGVPDLEFLTFDDWCSPDGAQQAPLPPASPGLCGRCGSNADVKAAIRVTRLEPVAHARAYPDSVPAG